MDLSTEYTLKKFNSVIENYKCIVEDEDYEKFQLNRNLLIKIAKVENSSLTVYDLNRKQYILSDSKFESKTGYSLNHEYKVNPDHFYKMMHPEDFPFVLETTIKTLFFLNDLPAQEKTDYKLIIDFRLSDKNGKYVRFIQQVVVLELDRSGKIWLLLKLVDLASDDAGNEPSQRKLLNMKTGKLYLFNDIENNPSENLLSKREIEVLGLISQGLKSKNIADRLFISVNTVNNHRQNILSKTKSANTSHALFYAKQIGII